MEQTPLSCESPVRDYERLYRLLIEDLSDYAVFLLDPSGCITTWNEGVSRLLGFSDEEFVGHDTSMIFTAEDRSLGVPAAELEEARQNGRALDNRWHVRKDGSRFYAEGLLRRVDNESGQPIGFVKVLRDGTARRRAEEEAARTARLLQGIIDGAPAFIYVKDPDGRITLSNRHFTESFAPAGAEGKTDYELFPAETADRFRANDLEVLRSREALHFEEEAPTPDGVHAYLTWKFPVFNGEQQPTGVCGISVDVTERRRLHEALAASEERFRRVWSNSPIGMAFVHPEQGTYLRANPALARMLEYTEEELAGMRLDQVCHAEDRGIRQREALQVFRGELDHVRFEKRFTTRGGRLVWGSVHTTLIRDTQGKPLYNLSIIEDVTERRTAEIELRRTQARMEAVIQQMPSGLAIAEPTGELLVHNEAAVRILRHGMRPSADVSAYAQYGAIHPDGTPYEPHEYPIAQAVRGQTVRNHHMLYRRGDGTIGHFDVSASPVYDGDTVIAGVSLFEDITDRLAAEDALRASEEMFRNLADSIPQLAWMADAGGRIVWRNQRWHNYIGANQAEEQAVDIRVRQALSTGESWEDTFQIRRHDGVPRWFLSRAVPFRNGHGEIARWFGTHTDVTDVREALAERDRLMQGLERSNRELTRFAHVVSHDLQAPVRTVRSFSELLGRRYGAQLDVDAHMYLSHIEEGARSMQDLISTLLRYATAVHDEIAPDAVDLGLVAAAALAQLRSWIEDTHATVDTEQLPRVSGDPVLLRQLFQNLVANAIKYRKPDLPPVVRISAVEGTAEWTIIVSDNGEGIAREYHEAIFAPLKRLHDDAVPGTGIGLAICKQIVERHGGSIWVESERGRGSAFYFTLPRVS